jgi:hypothetical protein
MMKNVITQSRGGGKEEETCPSENGDSLFFRDIGARLQDYRVLQKHRITI